MIREPVSRPVSVAEDESSLRDWCTLLRPRVAAMVALVSILGGLLVPEATAGGVLEAALWITLVTACASALNQVLERDTDRLMERTWNRPLARGRLAVRDVILFALALGATGTLGLALRFNLLAATLALATLFTYVSIYTPLKRVSTLNTLVGALPGAMPPVLGYVAASGVVGPWAWALFAILFAWQFPHFMAIAWLYRADYKRAGLAMLPAIDGADGIAGRQAILYGSALVPVSLLPCTNGLAGPVYAAGALGLGLVYLIASIAFALRENRPRARRLLYVSLVYLPALLAVVLLDPAVRTAIRS
jgi:protoheme IX farnesyltransferase